MKRSLKWHRQRTRMVGGFAPLLIGAALLVGGCFSGAELDGADRFQEVSSSYPSAACAEEIFFSQCSGAICHGGGSTPPRGGIDLVAPGYPARLYDQSASYPSVAASDMCPPTTAEKLIDPAGVEASLLWKKVSSTQTCGDAMPPPTGLEGADQECLRSLIQEIIAKPPQP